MVIMDAASLTYCSAFLPFQGLTVAMRSTNVYAIRLATLPLLHDLPVLPRKSPALAELHDRLSRR